jgi:hypothetical protein
LVHALPYLGEDGLKLVEASRAIGFGAHGLECTLKGFW